MKFQYLFGAGGDRFSSKCFLTRSAIVPLLVALFLWSAFVPVDCGMTTTFRDEAAQTSSILSSNWKWTQCYQELTGGVELAGGTVNQDRVNGSSVGVYNNFVVAINFVAGTATAIDLSYGKIVGSMSNISSSAAYNLLPTGLLLQTSVGNITAWSVPELQQLWSFQISDPVQQGRVISSSTGNFFCIIVEKSWHYFPSCYRVADGSFLWSGNLSGHHLVESNGVLMGWSGNPISIETVAIDVQRGTHLWTFTDSFVTPILAHGDMLLMSITGSYQLLAVNISHATDTAWFATVFNSQDVQVVAGDGLFITPTGAYSLASGNSIWSFPPDACSFGATLTSRPGKSGSQFLCPNFTSTGFSYFVGETLTGVSGQMRTVMTSESGTLFAGERSFYYLDQRTAKDGLCLHELRD